MRHIGLVEADFPPFIGPLLRIFSPRQADILIRHISLTPSEHEKSVNFFSRYSEKSTTEMDVLGNGFYLGILFVSKR